MSTLLKELAQIAQTRSVEESAQFAQDCRDSTCLHTEPDVQAAWEAEIADRIARYERGETNPIPAEDVFAAARRLAR